LANGIPKILPKGSKVSQNNVAREAGCTPSALRKERFPNLIERIKTFIERTEVKEKNSQFSLNNKGVSHPIKIKAQRFEILEADSTSKILSLLAEVSELRAHILKLQSNENEAKIINFNNPEK